MAASATTRSSRRRATRGTPSSRPAARAPARPPRWPPASARSRSAATAAARSACPPPSPASSASSRPWAAFRSGRAAATRRCPASPAGNRSSTTARLRAPSPTRPCSSLRSTGPDRRDRLSLPDEGVDWLAASGDGVAEGAPDRLVPALGGPAGRARRCWRWPRKRRAASSGTSALHRRRDGVAVRRSHRSRPRHRRARDRHHRSAGSRQGPRAPPVAVRCARSSAQKWTGEAFTDAITARKGAVNAMTRFMEGFDLILTPTAPLAPFAIDRDGPGLIDGVDGRRRCLDAPPLSGEPHRPACRKRSGRMDAGRSPRRAADHRPAAR